MLVEQHSRNYLGKMKHSSEILITSCVPSINYNYKYKAVDLKILLNYLFKSYSINEKPYNCGLAHTVLRQNNPSSYKYTLNLYYPLRFEK